MADRHSATADDAASMIEVDSRVGLLLHAISRPKTSSSILVSALGALKTELINDAVGHESKRDYAAAFVDSGALASVWAALHQYFDRADLVSAALDVIDAAVQHTGTGSTTTWLDADALVVAADVARHMVNTGNKTCLLQLVAVFDRLSPEITRTTSDSFIEIITQIIAGPLQDEDLLISCFRCLSELVSCHSGKLSRMEISDASANIITKSLATLLMSADIGATSSGLVQTALASLPVVLCLIAQNGASSNQVVGLPLLTSTLRGVSQARDLSDVEMVRVQRSLGNRGFAELIQEFIDPRTHEQTIDLTRHVGLAVLWRSQAARFLEQDGTKHLMRVLQDAVTSRNLHLLTSGTCLLHHVCITQPQVIASHPQAPRWMDILHSVLVMDAAVAEASDELAYHVISSVLALVQVNIHGEYTDQVTSDSWLRLSVQMLNEYAKYRATAQCIVRLFALVLDATVDLKASQDAPALARSLMELRHWVLSQSEMAGDFIRALHFSFKISLSTSVVKGTIKDVVRVVRSRLKDSSLLLDVCGLLTLWLETDPTHRTELIDCGVVSLVAKALFIHQDRDPDLTSSLRSILDRTVHTVDATRSTSVLQTLVQTWKQSLAPPSDMENYVDTLELCCSVLAALAQQHRYTSQNLADEVGPLLCRVLERSVGDHEQLAPSVKTRVVRCCVFALHRVIDSRPVTLMEDVGNKMIECVVQSTTQLISDVILVDSSTLLLCCRFLHRVIAKYVWAIDAAANTGWLRVSAKILVNETACIPMDLLESLLTTTAALLLLRDGNHGTDLRVLTDAVVRVGLRITAQDDSADLILIQLVLRNMEALVARGETLSILVAVQYLHLVHESLDAVGVANVDKLLPRCDRIVDAICTTPVLDALARFLEVPPGGDRESRLKQAQSAVAVILFVDERLEVVAGRSHRFHNKMLSILQDDSGDAAPSLWSSVCTGLHLLSPTATARVSRQRHLCDVLVDGEDNTPSPLCLYQLLRSQNDEAKQAIATGLSRAIPRAFERGQFSNIRRISSALQLAIDELDCLGSIEQRDLLPACTFAIRQWTHPSDGHHISASQIAGILRLWTSLMRNGTSPSTDQIPSVQQITDHCLGAIREYFFVASTVESLASPLRTSALPDLLVALSALLRWIVSTGVDSARELLQDPMIQQLLKTDSSVLGSNKSAHIEWCWALVALVFEEHGRILGERVLAQLPSPCQFLVDAFTAMPSVRDSSVWYQAMDCVAVMHNINGWDPLSLSAQVEVVVEELQRGGDSGGHRFNTRLSLVLLSFSKQRSIDDADQVPPIQQQCVHLIELLLTTDQQAPRDQVGVFLELALRLLRQAVEKSPLPIADATIDRIVRRLAPGYVDQPAVVASLLDLASVEHVYSMQASSALSMIKKHPSLIQVLSHCLSVCSTVDLPPLLSSTSRFASSLADAFVEDRDGVEAEVLAMVINACSSNRELQHLAMRPFIERHHGSERLLEIASLKWSTRPALAVDIVNNVAHRVHILRRKPVRVGDAVVALLVQMAALDNADTSDDKAEQQVVTTRTVEAALALLSVLVGVKRYALCALDAGCLQALYSVLSLSERNESLCLLAMDVCSQLMRHEEGMASPGMFPLLKLLLLLAEAQDVFVRPAFAVLEQCIALASPVFTHSPLTQMARTSLLQWRRVCPEEEIDDAMAKLSVLRTRLLYKWRSSKDTRTSTEQELVAIKQAIIDYHGVVEYQRGDESPTSYVDVSRRVRADEDLVASYATLRSALLHVRERLMQGHVGWSDSITRDLLPLIARVVILHASVTSDVVCVAMDVLSGLSFELSHSQMVATVDIEALLVACGLHVTRAFDFAQTAAIFCENIVADRVGETTVRSIIPVIAALMQQYPEDCDITRSTVACLKTALASNASIASVVGTSDVPSLLFTLLSRHSHDVVLLHDTLACLVCLVLVTQPPTSSAVGESVCSLLHVMRVNRSHSFIVRVAQQIVVMLEKCASQPVRAILKTRDAIDALALTLTAHFDDKTITRHSMKLLIEGLAAYDRTVSTQSLVEDLIVRHRLHATLLQVCQLWMDDVECCALGLELLLGLIEDKGNGSHAVAAQERLTTELLDDGVLGLLFDVFGFFSSPFNATVLGLMLELLNDLMCSQMVRDTVEQAQGLSKLREIIEKVWMRHRIEALLESAIDCLVNAACSNHFDVAWCRMPKWLTLLAGSVHEEGIAPTCVEKVIGILARLAVHPFIAVDIATNCSHTLLEMLALAGDDRFLESTLFALLCQLSFDPGSRRMLVVFDVVATVTERLQHHVSSDCDALALDAVECLSAIASDDDTLPLCQDLVLERLLRTIIDNPKTSSRLQQAACSLADRTTVREPVILRKLKSLSRLPASPRSEGLEAVRPAEPFAAPQAGGNDTQSVASKSPHLQLLSRGGIFHLSRESAHSRRKANQHTKRERVSLTLAESGDYLLLRNLSVNPPTIERIFLSQVQLVSDGERTPLPASPSVSSKSLRRLGIAKAISMPAVLSRFAKSDCTIQLMIKKELVVLEACSVEERQAWETALSSVVSAPLD